MRIGLIVATCLLATPLAARTVVVNVNGYTLTVAGELDHFAGLVIGDDGHVERLLHASDPLPSGHRVDLHGKTLLPGLIDAHGHVMEMGYQALSVDLNGTPTLATALAKVKAYAAANPQAQWIVGGGWNQQRWGLSRFPTAAELDAAVADRPVWLSRVDGHAGWANSRALAAAGITAATPDPSGGRIERDGAGNPTGVLVDSAKALVEAKLPKPTSVEADRALAKALAMLAEVGLTGVGDAGIDRATWDRYRRFAAMGKLTTRIYALAGGMAELAAIAPAGPIGWSFDDRLAMRGVKLYADGALGSRGAWLKAPYSDEPGNRGLQFLTGTALADAVAKATGGGFQVAVHAIGDAANAQVLDAYARVPAATRAVLRLRIEHAQIVDPGDLPRFAALGIIASMQPTHATSDKGMAEARLGEARLAGSYAWATLLRSGARLAGGSDFPVEPPNPLFGIHAAVTRQDRSGQPAGGWRPAERLSRVQALAAFTIGGAYAAFAETRVGTLEPGKWADFVVTDRDPFTVPAEELWQVRAEQTWLAGKPVYRR